MVRDPQFSGERLVNIIVNRIGVDVFTEQMDAVRRSPAFASAEQHGASLIRTEAPLLREGLFDYEFTLLFKSCYTKIHRLATQGYGGVCVCCVDF